MVFMGIWGLGKVDYRIKGERKGECGIEYLEGGGRGVLWKCLGFWVS